MSWRPWAGILFLAGTAHLGGAPAPALMAGTQSAQGLAPPNSLDQALRTAQKDQGLPLEFAHQALLHLEVHFHDLPGFSPALFSEDPIPYLEGRLPADGSASAPSPRLYLDSRAYLQEEAFRPLVDLPVDSSEYLFNSLLYAYLREFPGQESTTAPQPQKAFLESRAAALLPGLSPELGLEAYLRALADFGSHALSVANQLERSARHHRSRGTDLCIHFDRRRSLFGLWDRIFQEQRYEARYYQPPKREGLGGRWIETGLSIQGKDKAWLVKAAFQGAWQGSRRADWAHRHCPDKKPDKK